VTVEQPLPAAVCCSEVEVTESVRSDLVGAMKAGDRERVGTLRMLLSELQKAAKEGSTDELAAVVARAVAQSGAETVKDLGRVMPIAMAEVAGRADGRRVSEQVRAALANA
jgi:uncharacterized protein YqeY